MTKQDLLPTVDWNEILLDSELTTKYDLKIFQALYSFEKHQAYASEIGMLLGHSGTTPQSRINLEVGKYAKRIAKKYDLKFTTRENDKLRYWDVFFNGWHEGVFFMWQLRPEIVAAMENNDLIEIEYLPEEIPNRDNSVLFEGAKKTVTINAYERNISAKEKCKEHWGTQCIICRFDFEKIYGKDYKDYVHVHHLIPISQIGKSYQINPISDMRPVCPNCHAVIHHKNNKTPLTIEELKSIVKRQLQIMN